MYFLMALSMTYYTALLFWPFCSKYYILQWWNWFKLFPWISKTTLISNVGSGRCQDLARTWYIWDLFKKGARTVLRFESLFQDLLSIYIIHLISHVKWFSKRKEKNQMKVEHIALASLILFRWNTPDIIHVSFR